MIHLWVVIVFSLFIFWTNFMFRSICGKALEKQTDWIIHKYILNNKYLAERGVAQVILGYLSFDYIILLYPFDSTRGFEIIMHTPLD